MNLVNTCDKAAKTVCISTWKEAQGWPGAGGFSGTFTRTRLLPVLERALWGPMGPEVSGLVPWEQDVSPGCSLCLPAGEMQTQEETMSGPSDGPQDPGAAVAMAGQGPGRVAPSYAPSFCFMNCFGAIIGFLLVSI